MLNHIFLALAVESLASCMGSVDEVLPNRNVKMCTCTCTGAYFAHTEEDLSGIGDCACACPCKATVPIAGLFSTIQSVNKSIDLQKKHLEIIEIEVQNDIPQTQGCSCTCLKSGCKCACIPKAAGTCSCNCTSDNACTCTCTCTVTKIGPWYYN